MRTPIRPLPESVERWMRRARWLRALDAAVAWLLLWGVLATLLQRLAATATATLAAALTAGGAFVPRLRVRWRPASAWAALVVSRPLRPGDRAWLIGPDEAQLVVVTGRRGLSLVIAFGARGPAEGIRIRRTRALLVPAD